MSLLEIKDLKTYFYVRDGELRAVDGISYHIDKGECVGLVGESGCGKSVSALSILRLVAYPPGMIVGGEVIFKGEDLLSVSEEDIRYVRGNQISMVFQEPTTSLNPVFSARFQLCEPLIMHRGLEKPAAREEAVKLLRLVGMPEAERRITDYPFQFSGGMQQRIMIAMALACNPDLLIADEPTTSVDVTVQAQILELIDSIRVRTGTAVLLITHNLGIVARHVERVNVMYAGRIVEVAATEVIYGQPMHPYSMALLAAVPRLDAPRERRLVGIPGRPPNLARLPRGCAFYPRCKFAIDRCKEQKPKLEQVGEDHYSACWRIGEMAELREQEKLRAMQG